MLWVTNSQTSSHVIHCLYIAWYRHFNWLIESDIYWMRLTQSSEAHTCPRVRSYCSQREHERYPGCLRLCSSYLSAARTGKHFSQLSVGRFTLIFSLTGCLYTIKHAAFQDKHRHSLSAYSPHSLRWGSGPGVALCLPSWRHTPSERAPPIIAAAKYTHRNSRGRKVTAISAATHRSGEEFSTLDSARQWNHNLV